jgi:hypothetical protein
MDETYCTYVGSFGLLKSATHKSLNPISDFSGLDPTTYSNIHPNAILHVCPQALPSFVNKVLPFIEVPFKLLTNNSDCTLPDDYKSESDIILNNPLLTTWFSQNCIGTHPKLVRIPIGLDYHSMRPNPGERKRMAWESKNNHEWGTKKHPTEQELDLTTLKNSSKPYSEREIRAYANFQFTIWTRYGKVDRKDAIEKISKDLVFYQPYKATRDVCWKNMVQCAFVVSPHGNGLDCHRTWEALALGCIPIVKTSGLYPLFDDLPVWIVKDWIEVTKENMHSKLFEFSVRDFNYEKLTLAYWRNILSQSTNATQDS